jgi:hypothetical protein
MSENRFTALTELGEGVQESLGRVLDPAEGDLAGALAELVLSASALGALADTIHRGVCPDCVRENALYQELALFHVAEWM